MGTTGRCRSRIVLVGHVSCYSMITPVLEMNESITVENNEKLFAVLSRNHSFSSFLGVRQRHC
jgi:hypothetical protein